jgi:hypothetical protein
MIDRTKLSGDQRKAIECWRFNAYRAMASTGWSYPVEQVWATSSVIFTSPPRDDRYTNGSRDSGPVYATESEAWDACLAEVRKRMDERMAELEKMAVKAHREAK